MMRNLLRTLPGWIASLILGIVAACAAVLLLLTKVLQEVPIVLFIILTVVFTLASAAVQALQSWQATQEKRLFIGLHPHVPDAGINRLPDARVAHTLLSQHKEELLASLPKPTQEHLPIALDTNQNNEGKRLISIAKMRKIEDRISRGEEVDKEELAALREAQRTIKESFTPLTAKLFATESRSREEYQREVTEYLEKLEKYYVSYAFVRFIDSKKALISFNLENTGGKAIIDLKVSFTFRSSGQLTLITKESMTFSSIPPERPVKYGKKPLLAMAPDLSSFLGGLRRPPATVTPPNPSIENGEVCSATFTPVDIRPHSTITLPGIHLAYSGTSSEPIEASWEATSTKLDGKVTGKFQIGISKEVHVVELAELEPARKCVEAGEGGWANFEQSQ